MTTLELKAELKKLIDKERSPKKLAAVRGLLVRTADEDQARQDMVETARRSEEDIKAGRVLTLDEFRKGTRSNIKALYAKKSRPVAKKRR